ncbi:6683_t:CDS:2, partial [Gigaspora margarita]
PLPEKIRILLRKIANQNDNPTSEDCTRFCEIHYIKTTIVTDGIQKVYLMEIDFILLESRIIQMKDELLNIINRKTKSYYYDFAIKPGYYGLQGLNIISSILSDLFLYTNCLMNNLIYSKSPVDYILEVLVPETALCLISQDKGNITLEDARKIMEDSSAFGDYMYANLEN